MCSLKRSNIFSEILCPTAIPNGNLSDTCGRKVGDSCNTFTCDYGYHEETGVEPFNCTDAGTWDYNLTTLCIGKYSMYTTTDNMVIIIYLVNGLRLDNIIKGRASTNSFRYANASIEAVSDDFVESCWLKNQRSQGKLKANNKSNLVQWKKKYLHYRG